MAEPVIIMDYDPLWPLQFERLSAYVLSGLGNLPVRIEHVGSTSVVGLASKPIIDMDVVVRNAAEVTQAIELLARLGYNHLGDLGIPGREAFTAPPNLFQHHLYLCIEDASELTRHVALRDYLRANPEAMAQYARLKRELADRFVDDRIGYTEAKSEFICDILARIHQP